jgi:hypothetical protein
LQEDVLETAFPFAPAYGDGLHGTGVKAGTVHHGGKRTGSGVEILRLVWNKTVLFEAQSQFHSVFQSGTGVAGNVIGDKVLFEAQAAVCFRIIIPEGFVGFRTGFAHGLKDTGGTVFRRDFELAAYMIAAKGFQENFSVPAVQFRIIKAEAGTDKNFFYAGELPEGFQDGKIFAVIGPEMGTGFGKETFPVRAEASGPLPGAGRREEVGGRTAYIVNVSLETRGLPEGGGFPDQAFLAAGGDGPALMEGNGAEGTAAKTAPVGG